MTPLNTIPCYIEIQIDMYIHIYSDNDCTRLITHKDMTRRKEKTVEGKKFEHLAEG